MNAGLDYQGILAEDPLAHLGLFRWIVEQLRDQFGTQFDSFLDDVASDVMEATRKRLKQEREMGIAPRSEKKFLGYTFIIAKNRVFDVLRKRRKKSEVVWDNRAEDVRASEAAFDREASEYWDDLLLRLPGAIRRLPDDFRNFIESYLGFLAKHPDGTLNEFAKTQGLSETNVRVKYYRARAMLRDILSEEGEQ